MFRSKETTIFRGLGEWRSQGRPTSLAVGTFDGVHFGHQALVRRAIEAARAKAYAALVLTFEPHPAQILRGHHHSRLSSAEEKLELLCALGPDAVVVLDFNGPLPSLSAEQFAKEVLYEALEARELHVGYNFHFGRGGEGCVDVLRQLGSDLEFSVKVLEPVVFDGDTISSSRIRRDLEEGHVENAHAQLGRYYRLIGTVVHGEGRGRNLGFPTANLKPEDDRILMPRFGVYLGQVYGEIEGKLNCLVSVGLSPTFGPREEPRVEVFIPGCSEDLYGKKLSVELDEWLRPEIRFDCKKSLIKRMNKDLSYLKRRAEK